MSTAFREAEKAWRDCARRGALDPRDPATFPPCCTAVSVVVDGHVVEGVSLSRPSGCFVWSRALSVAEQRSIAWQLLRDCCGPRDAVSDAVPRRAGSIGPSAGCSVASAAASDAAEAAACDDWRDRVERLHWVTLGYHYDWTARRYVQPRDGDEPLPSFLAELAARWAEASGFSVRAQAAIVNLYTQRSTMGGHRDELELTYDYPVVSLSLGMSAVFLIGASLRLPHGFYAG
jgi:hypothetical protein